MTIADASNARPSRFIRIGGRLRDALAVTGGALLAAFAVGLAADIQSFDRTKGGYEAPYEGWTGEPVDWAAVDVTPTGMARRGYVSNTEIDCATGMITVQIFGLDIPFRSFSERALVVHKPREACVARGFDPSF